MTAPLISCVVPVFNGERYLGEALDSILAQTYRPLELLVVDDGSTDGTAALVTRYRDQIRPLFQPNAGQAAARNLGLSVARGEFVAFLDADDLWHPEKLARQMA
jgi:glycosyltransferase involved in cell wall biosynthesis